MRTVEKSALVLFALVTLAACRVLGPGESECGSVVCQPGQYCFGGGICSNGCTSDANCLQGSRCTGIDEVTGEGRCAESEAPPQQNQEPEPEPEPEPLDPEASCNASIDRYQECGMTAADAADARRDCNDVTEDQAAVLANCAELSCSAVLTCLDIDCFNDGDCPAGDSCVGNTCL